MTPRGKPRDVPASIRQRLLNLAREQGIRFNSVLQRYAAERFLYRLSVSGETNRFTLPRFLGPVCDSLIAESPFTQAWHAGGPWRPG